jgi:KUP system potassium uptake protein
MTDQQQPPSTNYVRSHVRTGSLTTMTEAPDRVGAHGHASTGIGWRAYASLGVVYGDIGTSVLYAVRECFNESHGLALNEANVLGICSLIIWAMTLVVSIKHIMYVLRADNHGEGGTMALLALITPRFTHGGVQKRSTGFIITIGLIGAALFAADGTITPAISVLSAVEGISFAAPGFSSGVVGITVAILIGLFLFQSGGTEKVAKFFAPLMLIWFITIGAMAIPHILRHPGIFAAINPVWGIRLLLTQGMSGFLVLGAVVLVITGGEALYADMGHFGRDAIRMAWLPVVKPALILNYLGQAALILERGTDVIDNPFFSMVDGWLIYPLVTISTIAAVIASQALITGSYSLTQQAIQLGFSPRLTIKHTSGETRGQIYVPEINHILMVICILLVIMFQTSGGLAGAYGISVMGTMMITSCLMFVVARRRWGWPMWQAVLMLVCFLSIEIPFFAANLPKIVDGGWVPICICMIVYCAMTTWKTGRAALIRRIQTKFYPIKDFVAKLSDHELNLTRVKGTAVFMTPNPRMTPPALLHHIEHNQVLHEQVILLAIVTSDIPVVAAKDILEVHSFGEGVYELIAHYGFMQSPKAGRILRLAKAQYGIVTEKNETTYYLGRDILLTDGPDKMPKWRKTLFAFLSRNSLSATAYFGIPPNRVVELGMQVNL